MSDSARRGKRRGGPFGELLRSKRQSAGLTIKDVASRMGLATTHISRLECGIHVPRSETIWRYAIAIGHDPRALWQACLAAKVEAPGYHE